MRVGSMLRVWMKSQTPNLKSRMMSSSAATTNPKSPTIMDEKVKSHAWTEWRALATNLTFRGYFDRPSSQELLRAELTPDDFRLCPKYFHRAASACLEFANEHPHLIDSLSRKDILPVVRYGIPSLFKDNKTAVRMKSFVRGGDQNNEVKDPEFIAEGLSLPQVIIHYIWIHEQGGLDNVIHEVAREAMLATKKGNDVTDEEIAKISYKYQLTLNELAKERGQADKGSDTGRAQTVDLMRYLLTEVYNPVFSSGPGRCGPGPYRNLLNELARETRVFQEERFTPFPYGFSS